MSKTLKVTGKFLEILSLEIERNDILKESEFSFFALSDEKVYEQAEQTFIEQLNAALFMDTNEGIFGG